MASSIGRASATGTRSRRDQPLAESHTCRLLTAEILAWAEEQLAADPALRPAQLAGPIEETFGVRVHPRSVERALARRRERHSKSR